MNSFFSNLKVSKPEFNLLSEGEHVLKVIRWELLNSFQQFNGEPKAELPEWSNPIDQIALTVVSAEQGKSGGLTIRLNGGGCKYYSDLSDEEIASGKYENYRGFACYTDDEGNLIREADEKHTQACVNIVNQIAAALQIPEGTPFLEGLESARENEVKFKATVVAQEWEGKEQLRLTKYKPVKELVESGD